MGDCDLLAISGLEVTYSIETFYSESLSKKNLLTLIFLLFPQRDDTNFSAPIMGNCDLLAISGLEATYSNETFYSESLSKKNFTNLDILALHILR